MNAEIRTEIKIDDDVPLPPGGKNGGRKEYYPFSRLEVGQSFFVADCSRQCISACSRRVARKHGAKFTQRKITENGIAGIRVWRIE